MRQLATRRAELLTAPERDGIERDERGSVRYAEQHGLGSLIERHDAHQRPGLDEHRGAEGCYDRPIRKA
jgi:hypothetical protein